MTGNKFTLAQRSLREPHPDRLSPSAEDYEVILAAHNNALDAGQRGYADPTTGAFVFTAQTLADQGYCCKSACRHCPYAD